MAGLLALVGSGEYLESMRDVEAHLLAGRPARYVQLATAAHPDGPDRVAYWHDLGRRQAERLGVEQIVVPVGTREEAMDPANADLVRGAGLIYLSGGDPARMGGARHRRWSGCAGARRVRARRRPSPRR